MKSGVHRTAIGIMLSFLVLGLYPLSGSAGELSETAEPSSRQGLALPDLSGRQRNLDEFAGKVLVVNFWASWCMPCLEEMPGMQRLTAAMRGKPFAIVAVNVGEAKRRVQATAKRLKLDFTILLDRDSTVFKNWGATVLPTSYVLDRSGRVRYIGQGPLEWDRADIVDTLGKLAEQQPQPR